MLPRSETVVPVVPVSRLSFEFWPDSEILKVTNGWSREHKGVDALCIVCVSRLLNQTLEQGDLTIWGSKHKDDFEPYWQDEKDWLCIVEFLPTDNPEARLFAADIIGYLVGYATLTNTRSLALLGDPDASAYELLFSFRSPEEKNEFLNLVRSNEDMGNEYIIELTPPTTEEIRNARPLATVLPHDALTHAMLIAVTLFARIEDDCAVS
jgi:hypothetical protein